MKSKEIQFYQDLSTRTLEKRAQKIPDLIAERKRGNTAYLVLDKLIIKRPRTNNTNEIFRYRSKSVNPNRGYMFLLQLLVIIIIIIIIIFYLIVFFSLIFPFCDITFFALRTR